MCRSRIVSDSFPSARQVERQLGYYHKGRFENHFRVVNKNFTDEQIAAGANRVRIRQTNS